MSTLLPRAGVRLQTELLFLSERHWHGGIYVISNHSRLRDNQDEEGTATGQEAAAGRPKSLRASTDVCGS